MAEIKHPVLERIREKTRQEKRYKLRFLWLKYWFKKYNISMKKETKREIFWIAVMILFLFIFFLTGCGSKKSVTEKIITEVDSTAVVSLQTELNVKNKIIKNLQTDLERFREDIIKLRSEVSKHEINYNTEAPLKPDGTYPIKSEVKTISKTEYERTIKEYEKIIEELDKKLEVSENKITSLEQTVEKLTEENKDFKSKNTPTTGFNFKLFFIALIAGIAVGVFLKLKL